jgi:hypothetical protein
VLLFLRILGHSCACTSWQAWCCSFGIENAATSTANYISIGQHHRSSVPTSTTTHTASGKEVFHPCCPKPTCMTNAPYKHDNVASHALVLFSKVEPACISTIAFVQAAIHRIQVHILMHLSTCCTVQPTVCTQDGMPPSFCVVLSCRSTIRSYPTLGISCCFSA